MKNKKTNELGYHTLKSNKPYVEGWYYKIHQDTLHCAIILGIQRIDHKLYGFIQFIQESQKELIYETYEEDEISLCNEPFQVRLQDTLMTQDHLTLHLKTHHIHADLSTSEFTPLQGSAFTSSIMGPFAYLPMECTHAIISLHHKVQGVMDINNQMHSIQAIGYLEKDWGVSFPKQYIWYQSNQLPFINSCFFLAVAHIPLNICSFTGIICVLMVEGKQRRFASYLGAFLKKRVIYKKDSKFHVDLIIQQGCYQLHVHIVQTGGTTLIAPKHGKMNIRIKECLHSDVHIDIYRKGDCIDSYDIYDGGCEIVGYS